MILSGHSGKFIVHRTLGACEAVLAGRDQAVLERCSSQFTLLEHAV
jgi:hypothetical protein